jgi:hypothetical protein
MMMFLCRSLSALGNEDADLERQLVEDIEDKSSFVFLDDQEVVVFENQRRQVLPPFNWGFGNLMAHERSRFSDESGTVSYNMPELDNISPPQGFQWCADPWYIDMTYTQTGFKNY